MIQKTQNKYPDISFNNVFDIYNIGQNMRRDPGYLEDSPYSETIRKTIRLIFGQEEAPINSSPVSRPQPEAINFADLDVSVETQYLFRETKAILNSNVLDDRDKATVIKTATSQMEKLINLIERAENINRVRDFESKVLRALKNVLPEKKDEFLQELARLEEKEDGRR